MGAFSFLFIPILIFQVRYIINGIHTAAKLQDILHHFVKRFVLCYECSNPETLLSVRNGRISLNCKACGYICQISAVSKVEGKMESYIIKNPIDDVTGAKKIGKKGKKAHEKKQRKSPDDERNTPTESVQTETLATNALDSDASEEWSENVTTITEKMKNCTATSLIQDEAVTQLSQQERSATFHKLANDIYLKKGIGGLKSSLTYLKSEASKLELENSAAPILAEILLTKSIIEEIPIAAPVLLHVS